MTYHSSFFNSAVYNPTFKLEFDRNGLSNLNPELTINGATVSATFVYKGQNADNSNWAAATVDGYKYGEDLSIAGSGDAPDVDQSAPFLNNTDKAVDFNEGQYYDANNTDFADLGTEDIVIEFIVYSRDEGSNKGFIAKRGGSPTVGWRVWNGGGTQFALYLFDSGGADSIFSGALPDGWYHVMVFCNRDEGSTNGAQFYINGVAKGSGADLSARSGDLSNAGNLQLGSGPGQGTTDDSIAYAAFWKRDNWHQAGASGPTEWATIAKERFHKLLGIYPQKSEGTSLATTSSRASIAYLDKYTDASTRRLFRMGSGWLRLCKRQDSNGNTINGYLSEGSITNELPTDSSNWTLSNTAVLQDDGYTSPDPSEGMVAVSPTDTAEGSYYIDPQTANALSNSTIYTGSIYLKAGAADWIMIETAGIGLGNDRFWVNISSGTEGTAQANMDTHLEDWGNDIYRVGITFTSPSDSIGSLRVWAVSGNEATTITPTATDTPLFYAWMPQLEDDALPTSPFPSISGGDNRPFDSLEFQPTVPNSQGSVSCKYLIPDHDNTNDTDMCLLVLSDGSNDNRVIIYGSNGSNERPISTILSGGTNQGTNQDTSTDGSDNTIRSIACTWKTNEHTLYIDGSQIQTDETVTTPTGMDTIHVGHLNVAGNRPLKGIISNIRIHNRSNKKNI